MTRAAFFAAQIQADVLKHRTELELTYQRTPDDSMYWAFVDLVDSSNFRLVRGPKEGYVRGESFFALITAATAPYGNIRRIKELGDGALLACQELRPLFEACLLMGQAASQLSHVAGDNRFPFAVRMAIGYGPVKRLAGRKDDDYLGSPIDQLARLSSSATPNELLLSDHAFKPHRHVLGEYSDFTSFDGPLQLTDQQTKNMVEAVWYHRVAVNRAAFAEHEGQFSAWEVGAQGVA